MSCKIVGFKGQVLIGIVASMHQVEHSCPRTLPLFVTLARGLAIQNGYCIHGSTMTQGTVLNQAIIELAPFCIFKICPTTPSGSFSSTRFLLFLRRVTFWKKIKRRLVGRLCKSPSTMKRDEGSSKWPVDGKMKDSWTYSSRH